MSDKEIIKELDKVINNNKDRVFVTGELNFVAMAESCKFKILDLQDQLQQKENIIKEVREYIENNWISQEDADYYRMMDDTELDIEISNIAVLFDILDKDYLKSDIMLDDETHNRNT